MTMACRKLNKDEQSINPIYTPTDYIPNLHSKMKIISESALYKLIMRSDKPEAKVFQDWVTRDVLPAIRKDGMYVKDEEKVLTGELSLEEMTLKVLEGLQSKVSRLTAENDALTEDVTRKQFVIEEMHDQVGALSEDNAALEAVKAEMEPMVASSIPCKFWY